MIGTRDDSYFFGGGGGDVGLFSLETILGGGDPEKPHSKFTSGTATIDCVLEVGGFAFFGLSVIKRLSYNP